MTSAASLWFFVAPIVIPGPISGRAIAGERVAAIVPDPTTKGKIKNLKWLEGESSEVELEVQGDDFKAVAILRGTFLKKEWSLMRDKKRILVSPKGEFKFEVAVSGKLNPFELTEVGPLGEVQSEKFLIMIPTWVKFKKDALSRPPKRFYLLPSFGASYITYKETGRTPVTFNETALTLKVGLTYLLIPPYWDFGFTAFGNLVPLSSSSEHKARFIGANVRFGLAIPFIKEPWRLSALAGLSYTHMFHTGRWGYAHVTWPQVYPVLRRAFKKGRNGYIYFKFASLGQGFKISMESRELATGVGFIMPLPNSHPLSFGLDFASTNMKFKVNEIKTNSLSFSIGYGW